MTRSWRRVAIHGGLVGSLILLMIVRPWWETGPLWLLLLVLGLPWTVPAFLDPYAYDDVPLLVHYVLFFGPAAANVAAHAGLVRLTEYLRRPRY